MQDFFRSTSMITLAISAMTGVGTYLTLDTWDVPLILSVPLALILAGVTLYFARRQDSV